MLDLNTGLTQVLSDGTTTYTYGLGRISQQTTDPLMTDIVPLWDYFLTDALGSVRQIVHAGGEVTLAKSYDPYGVVTHATGTSPTLYGFTGEQQDSSGLTYLRARYYNPMNGRFQSRDTWSGDVKRPLSLNRWMYVEGNPVNLVDITGETPLRLGYVEGFSIGGGLGNGSIAGAEIVYDYATMTRARFTYSGIVGSVFLASYGAAIYAGQISGFRYDTNTQSHIIKDDYEGPFIGGYGGICIACIPLVGGLSGGGGYFHSPDWSIKGLFSYVSAGIGPLPGEVVGFETKYDIDPDALPRGVVEYYADKDGHVNRGKLISDILAGNHSPALGAVSGLVANFSGARSGQIGLALLGAKLFEDYHINNSYTCPKPQQPYGPSDPSKTPLPPTPIPPLPDPFRIPDPFWTL